MRVVRPPTERLTDDVMRRQGKIILAPMHGVADHLLRDLITRLGGYDGTVSEFFRISNSVLPHRAYQKICPEIHNGSKTPAGTPLVVQLLGSHPELLGLNAARLSIISNAGVDLNFGCPAKTVGRHGGGAVLLNDPMLLNRIVVSVRSSVPPDFPVTAKMRLGVSDTSRAIDCANALAEGGVKSIVVHARTKDDGYRPPAYWDWIARIADAVDVPVIANGEVWTVADWRRCRAISGCRDVMIGRGAVADPFLAKRIKGEMDESPGPNDWNRLQELIIEYWTRVNHYVHPMKCPGRLKLLLGYFRRTWPEAEDLYSAIRPLHDHQEIAKTLAANVK